MKLSGKKAVITGGSRGIGSAISVALAREGAEVLLTYFRDREAAENTAAEIAAAGSKAHIVQANVAETADIERLFEEAKKCLGSLDIFVSNAVAATLRPALELKRRHWDLVLNANLTAFFEGSRRAVELMEGRKGNIIGISSLGARQYFAGYAALGAAKAGMEIFARYLAAELAPRNVNVNVICPGLVETAALEAFSGVMPSVEDFKQGLVDKTPAGRIGTPEDAANLVVFLCSEQAEWIRGQTIISDGGLSFQ